ncbi:MULTISPECIES: hypothetical protein [unclassified Pseudomonas]|uniref:hypothetical protein n=1 Tax=unclassified Pseudomonas TaxID=196821 RepID=UPI002118653A|nr:MULTISPECIES: hypothetical protein [unclassified Pseudomonas]
MQAIRFLHRALAQALPSIHSRRLTTLVSCVSSLLQGRRLTLTGLGRSMPGQAYPKHAIKRVDRLLGNQHGGRKGLEVLEKALRDEVRHQAQSLE